MGYPLSSLVSSAGTNSMVRERGRAVLGELRSLMTRPVVQTRAIVSLIALVLSWVTPHLGPPIEITPFIIGYLVVTIVGAAVLGDRMTHKFWRTMPELLDVVVISVVINKTGVIESPWFLLYLFPVMSVSRFLGRR